MAGSVGLALVAIAGSALAGVMVSTVEPHVWLSPPGAEVGKTLDSDETFEMTLHLQADADATYGLAVTYEGDDVGTCQEDVAVLATNPQGKAVWTCEFDTAPNGGAEDLSGIVHLLVSSETEEVGAVDALLSVRPAEAEAEEEEEVVETAETVEASESEGSENHGHCVSYWAHAAKEAGLQGRWYGAFGSAVARDDAAVAPKGEPGEDCDFQDQLDAALAEQEAAEAAEEEARAERDEAKAQRAAEREAKKAARHGDQNDEGSTDG
jgi:hypothetical protein